MLVKIESDIDLRFTSLKITEPVVDENFDFSITQKS